MGRKGLIIIGALLVVAAVAALFLYYGKRGGATALAKVNGQAITIEHFLREMDKVGEPERGMFKEDPAKFLDLMIMRSLVLQEVRDQGFDKAGEGNEEDVIRQFFEKKFPNPPTVGKDEVEAFYETHKSRMGGMIFEEAAPRIEELLRRGKQEEEYMQFVEELRSKADIEIAHERLQALAAKPTDGTNTKEEFFTALKSGRPVLVDFGSNSCTPCRQMRPILKEIKEEKTGEVEVIVIDVYKHQDLSREYRVQVVPTLVFFDGTGKEVFRTQGFMPKAALMEHLAKVGVV